MSGTAALSAAKNRRSGNEVKFNGQSKSLPPPQNTRQPAQQQNNRQPVQQQQQQQQMQQQQAPHPMEILKSHELRLQEVEKSTIAQDFSCHIDDYLSSKSDLALLKSDYSLLKTDYSLFKNSVNFFEKNNAAIAERANNNSYLEQTLTSLKIRVEELSQIIFTLSAHLCKVESLVEEHSTLIAETVCNCNASDTMVDNMVDTTVDATINRSAPALVDAPAPAVDAPAPTVDAPAPTVDAPAPAVDTPAPAVDTPAPAVAAPKEQNIQLEISPL